MLTQLVVGESVHTVPGQQSERTLPCRGASDSSCLTAIAERNAVAAAQTIVALQ